MQMWFLWSKQSRRWIHLLMIPEKKSVRVCVAFRRKMLLRSKEKGKIETYLSFRGSCSRNKFSTLISTLLASL